MSATKDFLIALQEEYSVVDLTELIYPILLDDEPTNNENETIQVLSVGEYAG